MNETLTILLTRMRLGLRGLAALLMLPLAGWGQASPLVISQLYGAGGNSGASLKNDYVELFNRSASSVSLSGYSLAYFSASGSASGTYTLAAGSIPAGAYYLVQLAGSATAAGAALTTPDQSTTTISMSATAGRLDLLLSGTLADRVGFGTATTYKGSGAAPAPSTTTAIFRVLGGCTDAGNNATDFVAGTPAPRNSGAVGNLCNGPASTISNFSPASGPVGASITLSGTGFTSSAAVTFNGVAGTVAFVNATTLTATVPSGATTGAIAVTTATGTATSTTNFTVTVPVLSASPIMLAGLVASQGAASPAQAFRLSGSSLDGTAVLIKPSTASLEVSLDGLTFGPTASLALTGSATLAPTPVYVRVASGVAVGLVSGTVTATSGTATASVAISGTVVTPLAPRRWTGAAGTESWFDAANWEGGVLPGPGDDVVLDHRYVAGKYKVVLGASSATAAVSVASLRLRPSAGDSILFRIPDTNTLPASATDGPALTLTRSQSGDTALYVGNRGFFTNASGAPSVTNGPAVLEVMGTNPTAFLANGGSYRHQSARSVISLVENLSAAPGTEAGNFYYRVPVSSYTTTTAGRTYGNLIFQRGSTNAGISSYPTSGSAPLTINGSLTIEPNVTFAATLLGNIVLRGNLLNAGNFRFAPNNTGTTARLLLQGTAPQIIAGTALADPSAGTDSYLSAAVQLEINNPAGVTLRTPVTLSNTLVLTSGVLTTDAASPLSLLATSPVQGGSDASFVSGPVQRPIGPITSSTPFVFPVGKGTAYRPITLTIATQSSTTIYRAEQFEGNASRSLTLPDPSGTDLTRVSQRRYFTLTPYGTDVVPIVTQPQGFLGNVTLSYGADDGVATPNASSLVIAKRADATQPWYNVGRQGTSTGPNTVSAGTVTSGDFRFFSDFALGSTDPVVATNPLPVQLAAFTATRRPGGLVALAWTTASEANSAHFNVERSFDGSVFTAIGQAAAAGTSLHPRGYAHLDGNAPATRLYYRLRQVDRDGTSHFSPVVAVATGPATELRLAPNPAHDLLTLTTEHPAAYTVRSVLGQVLLSGTVASGPATVPVAGLPAGVYFLELRTAEGRVVQRFAKE
ncbi:hypothetical protein GCM10023172_37840 [Hymenobacter ginsengisoli]|uniref:LTD domain-containing protein n=1 Tax=Hymenobacter ginsengisoli TaxID=1051626 RepID=A0ABP8QTI1_9BACT|nr:MULTISPECIES: lamin tail domain-containing protein [unclassified Hymenobacter]MBO2032821.1 lamin tail domain-containing protein [Hymenobacter sp. BT559]